MRVAVSTSTVQTPTTDDWRETTEGMPVSATQTASWEEIKKRVLPELGMSEDLADACIEFPEALCQQLRNFTEANMPSCSCQRTRTVSVDGDSEDDSEISTSSGGREEGEESEPQDDERNDEPASNDAVNEDVSSDPQESGEPPANQETQGLIRGEHSAAASS